MSPFWRMLFQGLADVVVSQVRSQGIEYTKIKAAKAYVLSVKALREQLTLLVTLMTCMTFVAVGFLLFVMGLGFVLPLTDTGLGIFFLVVGLVTGIAPVLVFRALNAEKRWIEKAKIDEIAHEAAEGASSRKLLPKRVGRAPEAVL